MWIQASQLHFDLVSRVAEIRHFTSSGSWHDSRLHFFISWWSGMLPYMFVLIETWSSGAKSTKCWHTFLSDVYPLPPVKKWERKSLNAFLKLFLLVLPIIYYNINCSKQRKQIAIFLFWIQADFIDEFVFISNIKFIDCWHLDFDIWLFWFCFVSFFFIDRCKLPVTHLLISLFLSKIWCAQQENKQHELCAFELMSYFWNEQNI